MAKPNPPARLKLPSRFKLELPAAFKNMIWKSDFNQTFRSYQDWRDGMTLYMSIHDKNGYWKGITTAHPDNNSKTIAASLLRHVCLGGEMYNIANRSTIRNDGKAIWNTIDEYYTKHFEDQQLTHYRKFYNNPSLDLGTYDEYKSKCIETIHFFHATESGQQNYPEHTLIKHICQPELHLHTKVPQEISLAAKIHIMTIYEADKKVEPTTWENTTLEALFEFTDRLVKIQHTAQELTEEHSVFATQDNVHRNAPACRHYAKGLCTRINCKYNHNIPQRLHSSNRSNRSHGPGKFRGRFNNRSNNRASNRPNGWNRNMSHTRQPQRGQYSNTRNQPTKRTVTPIDQQVCYRFQRGTCSDDTCPRRHVQSTNSTNPQPHGQRHHQRQARGSTQRFNKHQSVNSVDTDTYSPHAYFTDEICSVTEQIISWDSPLFDAEPCRTASDQGDINDDNTITTDTTHTKRLRPNPTTGTHIPDSQFSQTDSSSVDFGIMSNINMVLIPNVDTTDLPELHSINTVDHQQSYPIQAISALADSGASLSIVQFPQYLHNWKPCTDRYLSDAGTAQHGHRHQVTGEGELLLHVLDLNSQDMLFVIPAVSVPTMHRPMINTTYLLSHLNYANTGDARGTIWHNSNGQSYKCTIRGGQEYFDGYLELPRLDVTSMLEDDSTNNSDTNTTPTVIDNPVPAPTNSSLPPPITTPVLPNVSNPESLTNDDPTDATTASDLSSDTEPTPMDPHDLTDYGDVINPDTMTTDDTPTFIPDYTEDPLESDNPTDVQSRCIPMPDLTPPQPQNDSSIGLLHNVIKHQHQTATHTKSPHQPATPTVPDNSPRHITIPTDTNTHFHKKYQRYTDDQLVDALSPVKYLSLPAKEVDYIRTRLAVLGTLTVRADRDNYLQLHCKLGHRSMSDTLLAAKYMQIPLDKYATIVCDACEINKAKRKPLTKKPNPTQQEPLNNFEKWHCDVWGPIMTPSAIGKFRYILIFIDSATRTTVSIPLSSHTAQSIALGLEKFFIQVRKMILHSQQHGLKITLGTRITTDSAAYFKSPSVNDYLRKHHMYAHWYSPPYLQALNGMAERVLGTLWNSAQSMMSAHNIPQQYWPLAFRHATHIYDRMPHSALIKGMSPYEMRTGKRPTLHHLHIFGARAWVLIDPTKRNKGDAKAKRAIYVGHDSDSDAPILLTRTKNGQDILITAHHVTIDDSVPQAVLDNVIPTAPSQSLQIDHLIERNMGTDIQSELQQTQIDQCTYVGSTSGPNKPLTPRNVTFYSLNHAKKNPTWGYLFSQDTLDAEVNELIRMGALKPIASKDILPAETIHRSTCLYTVKVLPDGKYKGKCRLVFHGQGQKQGVDYDYKYSMTPRWSTIHLHLSLRPTTPEATELWLADIKKAFVRTPNETPTGKRVVLRLQSDAHYQDDSGVKWDLMEVVSALYGQTNAGYLWQQALWKFFKNHKWKQGPDQCSWTRGSARVIVWTDDLICRGTIKDKVQFMQELNAVFPGSTCNDGTRILGHDVYKHPDNTFSISAQTMIEEMANRFNITTLNLTPLPANIQITKGNIDQGNTATPEHRRLYQQIIGCISYLATTTRLDIAYAASALGQAAINPSPQHMKYARRTMGYLLRTKSYSIRYYCRGGSKRDKFILNCLIAFADASYACSPNHRSQTGFIIICNGGPIAWKSKCQRYVSMSSQEAEIIAASDCIREIQFLNKLLTAWNNLHWTCAPTLPVQLYEDNAGCISFFENGELTDRTKHFDVRLTHIRQELKISRSIILHYIQTDDNIADICTKALAQHKQSKFTRQCLNTNDTNETQNTHDCMQSVCRHTPASITPEQTHELVAAVMDVTGLYRPTTALHGAVGANFSSRMIFP